MSAVNSRHEKLAQQVSLLLFLIKKKNINSVSIKLHTLMYGGYVQNIQG